jgi:hypothetical protein
VLDSRHDRRIRTGAGPRSPASGPGSPRNHGLVEPRGQARGPWKTTPQAGTSRPRVRAPPPSAPMFGFVWPRAIALRLPGAVPDRLRMSRTKPHEVRGVPRATGDIRPAASLGGRDRPWPGPDGGVDSREATMLDEHARRLTVGFMSTCALISSGCEALGTAAQSTTVQGAAAGGALGAGTGAIIGNQTGHAGAGTAIGAGIGALSGAQSATRCEQPPQAPPQRQDEGLPLGRRTLRRRRTLLPHARGGAARPNLVTPIRRR